MDVTNGTIEEMIDAFDTRAYRFELGPRQIEDVVIDPQNLTVNPSYEESANVGTPDGCHTGKGGDVAASMFVDPREARHGLHSLRLTTPAKGKGIGYTHFWMPLKKNVRYRLSVWAKAQAPGTMFRISFDGLGIKQHEFELGTQWKQYAMDGVVAQDVDRATGLRMNYVGPGTAWFDLLQVVPIED